MDILTAVIIVAVIGLVLGLGLAVEYVVAVGNGLKTLYNLLTVDRS